jgi:hypothetical protein
MNHTGDFSVQLGEIRRIHEQFHLCGIIGNDLLTLPDEALSYILGVLHRTAVTAPDVPLDTWRKMLTLLEYHWVCPLFYWNLSSFPPSCQPPEEIRSLLRKSFLFSRVHSLRVEQQLIPLFDAFRDAGIQALLIKGNACARSFYSDPALRSGSDIDLMVHPSQMMLCEELMRREGYSQEDSQFQRSPEYYYDETFYPQQTGELRDPIEVHWQYYPQIGGADTSIVDGFFARALPVEEGLLTFERMHPVDALIHSAQHIAVKHTNDIRLIWIYDIAILAGRLTPEDWQTLQSRCGEYNARLAVEMSLRMAHLWCGLQIPPDVADFSTWPLPSRTEQRAWKYLPEKDRRISAYLLHSLQRHRTASAKISEIPRVLFPRTNAFQEGFDADNAFTAYIRRLRRILDQFRL